MTEALDASLADIAAGRLDDAEAAQAEARQMLADKELVRARALGLQDDDVPLTDEYRQTLREKIARGARSLREGRVTDGEIFMARMDDELAELERKGNQ